MADIAFPREIHDELISEGKARPQAGVVSYSVREPEVVPGAVELFRMSYDRAKSAAEGRQSA